MVQHVWVKRLAVKYVLSHPKRKNPFTSSLRSRSPYTSKIVNVSMDSDRQRGYEIEILVPAYHTLDVPVSERPLEVEQRASIFFGML